MNETLDPKFSNDAPVASNLEDRLNRTAFASQIGDILASLPLGTSLTVGIHGPWGDGKTSVLNLVKAGLSERPGIVYTDFNPWRMTNEEAMFRGFIDSLADGIGKSLSTKTEQVIAATSKWSLRFRRFTKVFGFFSTAGKTADELLQKLGEVAVAGDSVALDELRTRIVSQLSASNIRIVVFIDDIDRLDKHEICTLFRLVKACADFPNVCYVLAFDDEAVSSALGEIYPGGSERAGRAFLEKIIQVPLKLPVAARDDLRSLCMEQVDRALKASEIELSQDQIGRFASAFDQGASARFDTPRAGKRYGNALMFVLPILKGEVNIVDLLLLEALRAFYPEIYDFVRAHHEDFSGIDQENRGKIFEVSPPIQSLQKIFIKMDQKTADAAKSLLGDLFPRCQAGRFGSDWLENWAKGMRVCSPAYCLRYFSYSLPHGDMSDMRVADIIEEAKDGEELKLVKSLERDFKDGRGRSLIEKLRAIEKTLDPQAAPALCIAVAKLADMIPNETGFFGSGLHSQAGILISFLIARVTDNMKRIAIAKLVVEAANPVWFGAECISWMHVSDEADKADHNTLTADETAEVRKVLIVRIKDRSADGFPLFDGDVRQESSLLYEWWRGEGREPVQFHLLKVFERDPNMICKFLQAMAPQKWGADDVIARVGNLDERNLKNIDLIFDLDALAVLIRKYCSGNFDSEEWLYDNNRPVGQRLAEQFMFIYKRRKRTAA